MINPLLIVSLGGALGAGLRYIISKVFVSTSAVFTYVALVNIIGCLVAGLIAGYLDKHVHSEAVRLFLITGILGGFTTFSAFSLDVLNMVNKGKAIDAVVYISISVIGSVAAALLGYFLINKILHG